MYINFLFEVPDVHEVCDLYFDLPPFALLTISGRELINFTCVDDSQGYFL